MTDTQNVYDLQAQSWQRRLNASQNQSTPTVEASAGRFEQNLQRSVTENLVKLRGNTAQILNMRDVAVRKTLEEQSIGSRPGRLFWLFASPSDGDKRTTAERRRTEEEIRQQYIASERQQGGSRLFGVNRVTGQQENWFGIDENGKAVWVREEPGEPGGPKLARVTTYYYGLEPKDPIFKIQSVQEASGNGTVMEVTPPLQLTVRELQNLTTSVTQLHEIVKPLYGVTNEMPQSSSTSSVNAADADIHGLSMPVDDSNLSLAA